MGGKVKVLSWGTPTCPPPSENLKHKGDHMPEAKTSVEAIEYIAGRLLENKHTIPGVLVITMEPGDPEDPTSFRAGFSSFAESADMQICMLSVAFGNVAEILNMDHETLAATLINISKTVVDYENN
jgi:hypothetical protein